MFRTLILTFLAAAVAALAPASGGECKLPLVRFISYPMTMHASGLVSIPIKINGIELPMLIDTGAFYSGLQRVVTDDLGIKPRPTYGGMIGFGGKQSNLHVVVDTVEIGGVVLRDRPMFVLPEGFLPDDFDGILGAEIMKYLDVDLDYSGGKISFFSQKHCEGRVVYWTNPAYAVSLPFEINRNNNIQFEATLDGKTVDVILDSGSTHTVMSLETAVSRFDLDETALAEKRGSHPFKALAFQGIEVRNPRIKLIPDETSRLIGASGAPKMILGQNIMRSLHMYIAYKEHKIYMTPAVINAATAE